MVASIQPTPLSRDLLLGSWRMVSWTCRVVETGERRDALGQNPHGWLVFTPERMMIIVLKSERGRPSDLLPTDAEKINLYDSMFA